MARKLSSDMQRVLLVMNTGEEIRRTGNSYKWHPNSEDWGKRVHGPTVRALARKGLIETHAAVTVEGTAHDALYRLTRKGKTIVDEEWEEWMLD